MKVKFNLNGHTQQGEVVATIVEEKNVNLRTTMQFIRFVVLLKDGAFTSVPIENCKKVRRWWQIKETMRDSLKEIEKRRAWYREVYPLEVHLTIPPEDPEDEEEYEKKLKAYEDALQKFKEKYG